jgi:hypothetical protein
MWTVTCEVWISAFDADAVRVAVYAPPFAESPKRNDSAVSAVAAVSRKDH